MKYLFKESLQKLTDQRLKSYYRRIKNHHYTIKAQYDDGDDSVLEDLKVSTVSYFDSKQELMERA